MISWLLKTAESLSPEKIVVVIGPDMERLAEAVKPHDVVIQKAQDGTGGAVKAAMPALNGFDGDVLILLGDVPLITKETIEDLRGARADAALSLLGCALPAPQAYGRVIVGRDKDAAYPVVEKIVEFKDASAEERAVQLINTGAFCVEGAKLAGWLDKLDSNNAQGEFYITQLPEIINAEGGIVRASITHDAAQIQGANTRAQLAELEKTAQARLRLAAMESGVTLIDPETVYFSHDTVIEADVMIEPNVFFGKGVHVESGVHIKAFSHIEGARIGKNTSVGPFARLRPGAEIGTNVKIGNFVEIKKAEIGKGSKISHLAYVGDCTMGADVNFSAGAITVNYDGFDKHQTIIRDGAMVGSNVNLVAPITVGKGAYVAAGSTISTDVPADALSITREKPRILEGWAAKLRKKKSGA